MRGPDPMGVAVLGEDGVAVCGVVVAGVCIALSHLTGNYIWDGMGSLAVGGMVDLFDLGIGIWCLVSLFLCLFICCCCLIVISCVI